MKISLQIAVRKLGPAALVAILASGAILCASSAQASAASAASTSAGAGAAATANKPAHSAANSTPKPAGSSSAAAAASSSPSAASAIQRQPKLVDLLKEGASSSGPDGGRPAPDDGQHYFDGKNPFADDSLWQMPVHLERDLGAGFENGPNDNMAKSASETSGAADRYADAADADDGHADHDDDHRSALVAGGGGGGGLSPQSASSSAPTVISASTDLKTAAGYHYPTHGYGHDAHHGYGHDGHHDHHGAAAGHHGADHYGKYFQYASVPYPYAWDFGYRRGNPYHTIERYEHGKGPHFQTKVKWSDKHGGYGVHVWDYNHDDHHSHHYGGHYDSHKPHYGHGAGHHGGHYGHH